MSPVSLCLLSAHFCSKYRGKRNPSHCASSHRRSPIEGEHSLVQGCWGEAASSPEVSTNMSRKVINWSRHSLRLEAWGEEAKTLHYRVRDFMHKTNLMEWMKCSTSEEHACLKDAEQRTGTWDVVPCGFSASPMHRKGLFQGAGVARGGCEDTPGSAIVLAGKE